MDPNWQPKRLYSQCSFPNCGHMIYGPEHSVHYGTRPGKRAFHVDEQRVLDIDETRAAGIDTSDFGNVSHGACPECYEREMQRLRDEVAQRRRDREQMQQQQQQAAGGTPGDGEGTAGE